MALSNSSCAAFSTSRRIPCKLLTAPCIPSSHFCLAFPAGSQALIAGSSYHRVLVHSEKCLSKTASATNIVGVQLNRIAGTPDISDFRKILRKVTCQAHGTEDRPLYKLSSDYDGEGPIELPPREMDMDPLAIPEASPIQVTASYLLSGAIGVLLFKALRRRAASTKETQFRSSGRSSSKSIRDEAREAVMDSIRKTPEISVPPPSPAKAAIGAIAAGIIALGLYKFTTSVEAAFRVKEVSQNYSIRNLTITVRTIISGLCYLATFVFAANSIGLTLYFFQLLIGFGVPDPPLPRDPFQSNESMPDKQVEDDDVK